MRKIVGSGHVVPIFHCAKMSLGARLAAVVSLNEDTSPNWSSNGLIGRRRRVL